ncbi:MAG: peptidylprolyl isomerase [Desulfobacteraceae bacterium]|nr:peptidylprolyl isomerase [Desulfobacteraceae bacterium]
MLATRIILFLLAIQLISVAAARAVISAPHSGAGENPIAAKVNDRPIYFSQLEPNITAALARYKKYGANNLSEETRKQIQKVELERQVAYELMAQAGERIIDGDVEQKVDESIKATHAADSKSEQSRTSLATDLKNAEYRKQVRQQIYVDRYLQKQGLKDLRVPDAEMRKYYEQNKASFKEAESVKVSHILIMLPKNPTSEEAAEARRKIERIRQEVLSGKDFAELATQFSACASAPSGGDLGYITHGYMPLEFDKVAFTLKVGDISDIVRTRHGFHIIKVIDRKPERIQEFGEVKAFIEKFLLTKAQAKWIEGLAETLKREAKVEVYLK